MLGKAFSIISNIIKMAIASKSGQVINNSSIQDSEVIEPQIPIQEDSVDKFTPELIKKVFIYTPLKNIQDNWPLIFHELELRDLTDQDMLIYILATIYVEDPIFLPISEKPSKYSDGDGKPDYDFLHYLGKGGNQTPADCSLYRGAGFIQLSLKNNYIDMDKKLELDGGLIEGGYIAACEPHIASAICSQYFQDRIEQIRPALEKRDFIKLRRIVNGGILGLDKFTDVFKKLEDLIK